MEQHITLRLDEKLLERATLYATKHKTTLQAMVENFVQSIAKEADLSPEKLPISDFVESMATKVNIPVDFNYKDEYGKHLTDKYMFGR